MTPARAGTSAVAAVLGAAVLVLVLVTWAASIGPERVVHGTAGIGEKATPTATPSSLSAEPAPTDPDELAHDLDGKAPDWLRTVALLVEMATAGVVLFLGVRGVRFLRERWDARVRRVRRRVDGVDFEVVDSSVDVGAAIEEDAGAQRALLEEGEPRNAIVACWHRFEQQARAAHVLRRPWETPSEFVLGVLDLAGADERAVTRLAELYREARFSDHPLTEEHRAQALAALADVHRSLVRSRPAAPAGER